MSTLRTIAFPAISSAVRATSGAAERQGPHHAAQKSTSTGTEALFRISSKRTGSAGNGSAIGASVPLHAPHRPVLARCVAVTRFFWLQCVQVRMTGKMGLCLLKISSIGCIIDTHFFRK